MRRQDRAVTEKPEIVEIVARCSVCRLGMVAQGRPYIVPLCFGEEWSADGRLTLYMHAAREGRKMDALRESPRVFLEMDRAINVTTAAEACGYGLNYESVMAEGAVRILENPVQRRTGLNAIMRKFAGRDDFSYAAAPMAAVAVLALDVDMATLSAKRRLAPGGSQTGGTPGPADKAGPDRAISCHRPGHGV